MRRRWRQWRLRRTLLPWRRNLCHVPRRAADRSGRRQVADSQTQRLHASRRDTTLWRRRRRRRRRLPTGQTSTYSPLKWTAALSWRAYLISTNISAPGHRLCTMHSAVTLARRLQLVGVSPNSEEKLTTSKWTNVERLSSARGAPTHFSASAAESTRSWENVRATRRS